MASSKCDEIKKNYEENLRAVDLHEELLRNLHNTKLFQLTLPFLHEVFQSGRFHGRKLLDIGSGPTFHNVASASAFFSSIVLSDFVEDNLQELKRWLKEESRLDWSEFFSIVAKLEGYNKNPDEGIKILESRVRGAVKSVTKCDLLAENVLDESQLTTQDTSPPYDLVMSFWCFEGIAPTVDSFRDLVKKVNRLLRSGGGFILSGFLGCDFWYTGKEKHHCLNISAEQVIQALKDAGFEDIDIRKQMNENTLDNYIHDSMFCLAAVKKPPSAGSIVNHFTHS